MNIPEESSQSAESVNPPVVEPTVAPASQTPPPPPWWNQAPPKRSGPLRKTVTYVGILLFIISILLNVYLMLALGAFVGQALVEEVLTEGQDDQIVAVYCVAGMINGESAAKFQKFYNRVYKDKNIKAVVLRVDSPGGGVSASDQIYTMLKSIREECGKPVVVSMGGVAASGGYYISAPANEIYAESTTMTGSIGVIMPLPIIKGFLDKHGVEVKMIRATQCQRWKAAVNYFENPDSEELRERQSMLDKVHGRFMKIVRDGRGEKLKTTDVAIKVKDFDGKEVVRFQTEPLNGRVYMADKAVEFGLVDKIGYLPDAITAAAALAKLNKPKVVSYSKPKTFKERLGFSDTPAVIVNPEIVEKFLTPRIMLLWTGQ